MSRISEPSTYISEKYFSDEKFQGKPSGTDGFQKLKSLNALGDDFSSSGSSQFFSVWKL